MSNLQILGIVLVVTGAIFYMWGAMHRKAPRFTPQQEPPTIEVRLSTTVHVVELTWRDMPLSMLDPQGILNRGGHFNVALDMRPNLAESRLMKGAA